jgi:hypothetical protein
MLYIYIYIYIYILSLFYPANVTGIFRNLAYVALLFVIIIIIIIIIIYMNISHTYYIKFMWPCPQK